MGRAGIIIAFALIMVIVVGFVLFYVPVIATGADTASGSTQDSDGSGLNLNMTATVEAQGYSVLAGATVQYQSLYINGEPCSGLSISISIVGYAVGISSANVSVYIKFRGGGYTVTLDSYTAPLNLGSTLHTLHSTTRQLSNSTIYTKLSSAGVPYNTEITADIFVTATITAVGAATGRTYTLQLYAEPASDWTVKLVYEELSADTGDSDSGDTGGGSTGGGGSGGTVIGTMSTLQGLGMLALVGLGFVLAAVYYNPKYRKRVRKAVKKLVG